MENPFRKINQPIPEVPRELRAKVMHDIAMAKLLMDLAELFSYNLSHIINSVTEKRNHQNK